MNDNEIKRKLQNVKKTYITLEEIEKIIEQNNYIELVNNITNLINDGIIKPIKTKNSTNGKIPSLFVKYRIIKQNKNEEIEKEIKHLSSEFNIEKYLENQQLYLAHRNIISQLDNFLKNNQNKLKVKLSKNERAYQIWNYEKMMDDKVCKSVISFNNLEKRLNYYLTPEPFFDYIPKIKEKMNILIIENKDAWYTLRKIFRETSKDSIKILGEEINGLVYGEGNKITKEKAITEYEKEIIGKDCTFIYWGDMDFTGIDMFERAKKQNINANIKLFTKIYEKMIELCNKNKIQKIHNLQNKNVDVESFCENFKSQNSKEFIKEILDNETYIPQEILNYEELIKICE